MTDCLKAHTFYICKFEVNHDHETCCTGCWSNLTLKCYDKIWESWCTSGGTVLKDYISYLKGYSYPKLYCKKLNNQNPTANIVSTTRRTTLCWMCSEIITWGQRWRTIWQSSYFSHYPQLQTACANVVANLKCLHKLISTRVFIAAEKWMVRRTGVDGLKFISPQNGNLQC